MSCPTCGGNQRTAIAPGFWRCETLVSHPIGGPGAQGLPGPPVLYQQRVCGTEYQLGGGPTWGAPLCACGTFAIGVCTQCQRPVDGTHSQMVSGTRWCTDCLGSQRSRAEAVLTSREDAFIAALMAIPDPVERGLTAILSRPSQDAVDRKRPELLKRVGARLSAEDLGPWVAQRAESLGIPPDGYADIVTTHKPRFSKPKERVVDSVAYWHAGRSQHTHSGGSAHFPTYGQRSGVVLTADGRCFTIKERGVRCPPSGPSETTLMWIGIIGLAQRLGVQPLPPA